MEVDDNRANGGVGGSPANLHRQSGCIAADTITPYPPGIPIITYGERISQEITDYMRDHPDAIGISNGCITVVKEES